MLFSQLYLTGAVYSLDGSDSLKDTMQTSIVLDNQVNIPVISNCEDINGIVYKYGVVLIKHYTSQAIFMSFLLIF